MKRSYLALGSLTASLVASLLCALMATSVMAQATGDAKSATSTEPAPGGAGMPGKEAEHPQKPGGGSKSLSKKTPSWWGADVTPGWSMMTWSERNEHRKRMRAMKSYDQCKAYIEQRHQKMADRARSKGDAPLPEAKRDACASLKP